LSTKGFIVRTLTLSVNKGIQDGLQALLLLWLARTDQSGYGLFVFGAGVALMVRAGLALGLDQYTLREFSSNEQSRAQLLSQIAGIKTILGGIILAGLMAFAVLKGWTGLQTKVVLIIVIGQIMECMADTFFNLFRAEGRQVREGLYRSAANIIGALYGAFCLFTGQNIVILAFFLVVSNFLKLITAFTGVVKFKLAPNLQWKVPLLPQGQITAIVTILGVGVLGSFYNSIQIFLLKQFNPLTEVALYGAAYDMAGGISGLVANLVIGAVLFPKLAAVAAKGSDHLAGFIRGYFINLITYGIGIAFFLSTLGGLVLTTLYGDKFIGSVKPLIILGPATLLSFVNNFGISVFLALRKERQLLKFHLFPVFLGLGAGLFLLPKFGSVGAAVNLLSCRAVMFVLIMGWLQRNLGVLQWYDLKQYLKAFLVMAICYLSLAWIEPYSAALASLGVYGAVTWKNYGGSTGHSRERVPEI